MNHFGYSARGGYFSTPSQSATETNYRPEPPIGHEEYPDLPYQASYHPQYVPEQYVYESELPASSGEEPYTTPTRPATEPAYRPEPPIIHDENFVPPPQASQRPPYLPEEFVYESRAHVRPDRKTHKRDKKVRSSRKDNSYTYERSSRNHDYDDKSLEELEDLIPGAFRILAPMGIDSIWSNKDLMEKWNEYMAVWNHYPREMRTDSKLVQKRRETNGAFEVLFAYRRRYAEQKRTESEYDSQEEDSPVPTGHAQGNFDEDYRKVHNELPESSRRAAS
ncbi:hypothetical protein K491DRAFT_720189 [Lophiostoma macrostomum CBS 122681]|uniref:Uncharacterized protein n=1 Tax=Lophiostoma macrostomum CBS 122681 TaxID=1314788 RepID=A0A6A6SWT1_9PLEO|nr:hypothetical protein K491DRAFT_720189 [Lophiostoma macrostomum CBS 122681]